MTKIDTLITVASWEDRSLLGVESILKNYDVKQTVMFFYEEFQDWSLENRDKIKLIFKEKQLPLFESKIWLKEYVKTWRFFENFFIGEIWKNKKILIDLTTMPREAIWVILSFLDVSNAEVHYIYFKPEEYDSSWLSRDPEKPRLVFRHSGISEFGKSTMLFAITGYDAERTSQLINYFEPVKTFLGVQAGEQFNNQTQNLKKHNIIESNYAGVNVLEVNSYSEDHGFSMLDELLSENKSKYNIILSSLGPKPSAIALYRAWKKHPEVALAYAPSNQFNENYSKGINLKPIVGEL